MNPYRSFITVGVALMAAALLMAAGIHGFWWFLGLAWVLGLFRGPRRMRACGGGAHYRRRSTALQSSTEPDPTRDRHNAFPTAP